MAEETKNTEKTTSAAKAADKVDLSQPIVIDKKKYRFTAKGFYNEESKKILVKDIFENQEKYAEELIALLEIKNQTILVPA